MPGNRRDQLVDTALRLFARDGYHATGVDRIVAESGVAKMTLYKHFRSKEELILAALRFEDQRFRNAFVREVERRSRTPSERLLATFDVLAGRLAEGEFRGCPLINAAAEYGDAADPVHAAAAESKRLLRAYVEELASSAGARWPRELALQLVLLMEGAIVVTQLGGPADAARQARTAAEILLEHALPEERI